MRAASRVVALAALLLAAPRAASAQHEHHQPTPDAPAPAMDTRHASGTAWLPAETPMFGLHRPAGGWEVMLHGNAFVQFLYESGEEHRRGHQLGSINWAMAMARRPLGGGTLGLRGMASLEPWTIGGCGYPDLLATGETCDGDSIHDRQHPHDLFMEAAIEYERPLRGPLRWQLYAGPAGEPALGPVGFPHRPSAMPNPVAPIGHHWLDASHITHGVVTGALFAERWKIDVSVFNGREPDEARADFDLAPLTSYSGRVSAMVSPRLLVQASAGHLDEAEESHDPGGPRTDVDRVTASAVAHHAIGEGGLWASTLAWGMNLEPEVTTHSMLLETALSTGPAHTVFGRFEMSGKPAHALHVFDAAEGEVFTVGKLQAGYLRSFAVGGLRPGIGGSLSFALVPDALAPRYGGRVAPGVAVFLNLSPPAHR